MKKLTVCLTALLASLVAQAVTVPTLARITPASAMQCANAVVTLTGTNFGSGMPVIVNSSAGVQVYAVTIVNSTTATAVLAVDCAASATTRSVVVARPGAVSNALTFTVTPNPAIVPAPAPTAAPTPPVSTSPAPTNTSPLPALPGAPVVLDSFDTLRVINPNETDPQWKYLWSQYGQCSNQGAQCRGDVSVVNGNLLDRVTLNNAYIQITSYDTSKNGWGLVHNLLASGSWTQNVYNRMRVWVKAPSGFQVPPVQEANLSFGTYTRASTFGNFSNAAEAGSSGQGWHWYHDFRIPVTGEWYQVVLDTHPTHQVSQPGATEWGDQLHPTGEPNWNYMDALTRFYLDFSYKPLTAVPGDFLLDDVEFFTDHPSANVQQVYSLGGSYSAATSRVYVGWQHPKNDGVTCHEVRYAATDIYALGWANATPAPNGTVCPASDVYAGMAYTGIIPATGTLYMAIRPIGAATFNQIAIPTVRP